MRSIVQPRPIRRLLIANRGEIAARIISAARELDIETLAVYSGNDVGHTYNAAHAIQLKSAASYMNIAEILQIAKDHNIDAIHPGYGYLSESSEFSRKAAEVDVLVVGPGADTLDRTGDKLRARLLAEECSVPVLPALTTPTGDVSKVQRFAEVNGLPVMVKAVDGGGGRGIRLIREARELPSLVTRAIEESPSRQVFAEKAAVDGFRHVEVQILGDGRGNVRHLWERECSIQRRYQKVVELAPSTATDRRVVVPLIEAAVEIAKRISYASLGTFEFLLNPSTGQFFFLEINPRLQVEHTITESICSTDIVKVQLRLAQGATFEQAGLESISQDPSLPPKQHSIQLRVTAEDPQKDYTLSIGKIQSFRFPSGAGTRVDTALLSGIPTVITSDFDSVIAKIIVTAGTWSDVVSKARRALEDTAIVGIVTNLNLLKAIVTHPDFVSGHCDTRWLEAKHAELIDASKHFEKARDPLHGLAAQQSSAGASSSIGTSGSTLFRKDDAWTINLKTSGGQDAVPHHLQLTKVLRNDFPDTFAADILYTIPGSKPQGLTMSLTSTTASSSAISAQHRKGDRTDPTHVLLPLSGKLVEVLVDAGDIVKKDDPLCVVKQMKMEVEIRSHRSGRVTWVTEAEDDEDVAEGMLAAIVEDESPQAKL